MIRTMGGESWGQEDEEPAVAGEVLMPVMESTPVKGRNRGGVDYWSHNLKLRPLIAPKKKWVEPERTDEADNVSSEDESCSTQRSATTEKSDKRQGTGGDCPIDVEVHTNPLRYGTRSIRTRVPTDREAGMCDTSAAGVDNTQMTGGDGVGVRVVSARSWWEGCEEGRGGDLDIGGDLEDLDH